jgi:hypothetical protein
MRSNANVNAFYGMLRRKGEDFFSILKHIHYRVSKMLASDNFIFRINEIGWSRHTRVQKNLHYFDLVFFLYYLGYNKFRVQSETSKKLTRLYIQLLQNTDI